MPVGVGFFIVFLLYIIIHKNMEKQASQNNRSKKKYIKRWVGIAVSLLAIFKGLECVQERRTINSIKSGWLEYTERWWWIDKWHTDPWWVRNLLNRINNPKDTLDDRCYAFVYYGQHQRRQGLKSWVVKQYLVQKGMTEEEKLSVALAILLEVSDAFEADQASTDFITGSSYNEADWFSNVLSLYIAAKICTKEQIRSLLNPVGIDSSLALYKRIKIGKNKDIRNIKKYSSTGDVIIAPYPFPFDQIKPAEKGILFKDFKGEK
jgi:hypothetical protein